MGSANFNIALVSFPTVKSRVMPIFYLLFELIINAAIGPAYVRRYIITSHISIVNPGSILIITIFFHSCFMALKKPRRAYVF